MYILLMEESSANCHDFAGGWEIIGLNRSKIKAEVNFSQLVGGEQLPRHGGGHAHALLFGVEGESNSRMAIDHDGTMRFGGGAGPFTTVIRPPVTNAGVEQWDPPSLPPSKAAKTLLSVEGALPGNSCVATHDSIGAKMVQLTCHVASKGQVLVVLRNVEDGEDVDVPAGRLKVVLTKYE